MSPLRVVTLALCLSSLLVGCAAATCAPSFGSYDFSSLAGTDYSLLASGGYNYYLAVCGALTTQASCTSSAPASACQVSTTTQTAYDQGNNVASPTWTYIDADDESKGVQYQLTGAQSCWQSGTEDNYIANVQLTCATSAGPLAVTSSGCTSNYTYPTPLACSGSSGGGGGGKKHKLSGGWVFIIILCVTIPLYVIGGCIYKAKRLGATGTDRCPNVEFWRDLPSLCKDGCVFTWGKLRGLCGGGGGNTGTYETM